jgi:Family of unknown function (DUF6182)
VLSTSPPPSQSRLAELLAERVEWVAGGSQGEPGASTADTTVLVLLRSFHLADMVHGVREFAAALEPGAAAAWRRSWTRTRFLFGNPANLTPGNRARVVAPAATAAWLGPFPDARWPGLSRLLKPVTGGLPELPREIDFPGVGPRRVLQVAIAGLTLVDYLVHLHHTLAEAVLLGRLRPKEPLRLSHLPAFGTGSACGPPAYARVLPEPGDTGRLRLHTWLSSV